MNFNRKPCSASSSFPVQHGHIAAIDNDYVDAAASCSPSSSSKKTMLSATKILTYQANFITTPTDNEDNEVASILSTSKSSKLKNKIAKWIKTGSEPAKTLAKDLHPSKLLSVHSTDARLKDHYSAPMKTVPMQYSNTSAGYGQVDINSTVNVIELVGGKKLLPPIPRDLPSEPSPIIPARRPIPSASSNKKEPQLQLMDEVKANSTEMMQMALNVASDRKNMFPYPKVTAKMAGIEFTDTDSDKFEPLSDFQNDSSCSSEAAFNNNRQRNFKGLKLPDNSPPSSVKSSSPSSSISQDSPILSQRLPFFSPQLLSKHKCSNSNTESSFSSLSSSSGSSSDIIYTVPDIHNVLNLPYYHGPIDHLEADKILDGKPDGSFLIRDSAQDSILFSISFRRYGRNLHTRIEETGHLYSFDIKNPRAIAKPTIRELLECYKEPSMSLYFEPLLTDPVNRTQPNSLEALCSSVVLQHVITYDRLEQLQLPNKLKDPLARYFYTHRCSIPTRSKRKDQIPSAQRN